MIASHAQPAGRQPGGSRANRLLEAIPASEREWLEPRWSRVSLKFKQVLYRLGDPIDRLYFPDSGVVSLVSVMRDGALVGTRAKADLTEIELVRLMTGREVSTPHPPEPIPAGSRTVLTLSGLATDGSVVELRQGEILGLAGLVGAGRTSIAHRIVGLRPRSGFTAELDGAPLPDDPARVLEAGCGSGAICRDLAARPGIGSVVGLDPSPAFLDHARRLAEGIGSLSFTIGDARALPFDDGSFDAVVFHTCLSHVPRPEAALAEAQRVTRSGGRLVVLEGDYATTTVAIAPEDPLHWTGLNHNWNFMCAECHSTNLRKNYDAAADRYATTWSEINVGCEACHGAGSRHVAWAERQPQRPRRRRGADPTVPRVPTNSYDRARAGRCPRRGRRATGRR